MKRHKCVVVDDEPLARALIINYINQLSDLELVGEFNSGIEVRNYLKENSVDIIFLDINMPDLTGMDLLISLENDQKVIFTTAYPQYAVEAFEYNAFDYLLKPISFDRFLKSVEKINKTHSRAKTQIIEKSITVKENKRLYKVSLKTIHYFEAYGDYVKVHTTEKTYTVKDRLSNYDKLNQSTFIRTHRSYIVNLDKIDFVEGNQVSISGNKIPISAGYKDGFFSAYNT